jgi:hypothetical protein
MNDYKATIDSTVSKLLTDIELDPKRWSELKHQATASLLQLITEARIEELEKVNKHLWRIKGFTDRGGTEKFVSNLLAELKEEK